MLHRIINRPRLLPATAKRLRHPDMANLDMANQDMDKRLRLLDMDNREMASQATVRLPLRGIAQAMRPRRSSPHINSPRAL
jgi:hypothetical protein